MTAYRWIIVQLLQMVVFISLSLYGQSRLELLHADFTRGRVLNGNTLKILEGNVHVRQDTVELYCQKATYYEDLKKIILEGSVKIQRGTETLTAQTITYYEDQKLAIAEHQVHLWKPGKEMFTEYLEYYYETDQALAKHDLLLHDEARRVFIWAEMGEYIPQEDRSYVEEGAHLWQVDSTGTDTLHIYARRMEYLFSPERKAIARDSVRIVYQNLVATCDSATYLVEKERAFLEINPHARQEESNLYGKQMELILNNFQIERVIVHGNARAVSMVDSLSEKENRLEGRKIIMFIARRKLQELWAISNASSVYYLEDNRRAQGINVASADTIRVFFKAGELDSIVVKGGSQGVYYPADYQGKIQRED